jgi:uncharacterized repeat protein (TIGR03847 family)
LSESFDLPDPDRFTAGTVGEPGHRVFYLQAGSATATVTLLLEKTQVGALAEYLADMLADLPTAPDHERPGPEDMALREPVDHAWVVGSIGVAYDEDDDRVMLVAEELGEEDADNATARLRLTRGQAAAFVDHARELVAAGRPPCPFCGRPLDPEGHVCPRSNGHLAS